MKRFEEELLKDDWTRVHPEVEVKKVAIPEGEETYILSRTGGRKEKERGCVIDLLSLIEKYGRETVARRAPPASPSLVGGFFHFAKCSSDSDCGDKCSSSIILMATANC